MLKKTPLKGLRFETLDEQTYLDHWEERWADTRIHGTTKRQVAAMFAEEKPALVPLPVEPFRYYQYGERTVHLDGCVEVEAAYYGAPPGWIERASAMGLRRVRLLDPQTGQLLREHLHLPRGDRRIKRRIAPKKTPLGTQQLLSRADRAGSRIRRSLPRHAPGAGRGFGAPHPGVMSLAKKYGVARVDDACGEALEAGITITTSCAGVQAESTAAAERTSGRSDPATHAVDFIDSKTNRESKE